MGGSALPRGLIDLGFSQRVLLFIGSFLFIEICMRLFLWLSSEGTVPGEKQPSELRYLGDVSLIRFGGYLRLNFNRSPNRLYSKRPKALVDVTE